MLEHLLIIALGDINIFLQYSVAYLTVLLICYVKNERYTQCIDTID